ncbi:MAG: YHS domain-containing protein [Ignavibacteriae bacterium]|nr:YHS domain-containing protein [Ignavibacteriota bacterium]
MVKDPVCGMNIEERSAAAISTFNGATYFFCAPGCKRLFDRDPKLFLHDSRGTLANMTKPLRTQLLRKSNHNSQQGE